MSIVNMMIAAAWLAMNLYTLILYGVDKRRARRQQWRISEKRLLLTSLCFGALGAFAGMRLFRHKTRKPAFAIGVPSMILAYGILAWYFFL